MERKRTFYERRLKRPLDIFGALLFLLLFGWLLAATALLVRFALGSPVIFAQQRAGFHGRVFKLYKFRSMNDAVDANGRLLPDAQRLTPFGLKLRRSSLDELPELWNVLKGDMSLVGPRPLLVQYLPLYNDFQRRRHDVRPGITGWAQVNGRNALSWEDKFAHDVWYTEHESFWLDLKILWMTFRAVFRREGISADGEATMPPFTGTKECH
ncbi:MAG: sugar transferase [Pyramidobacter sp.]|jgi:lipopolysaccharide/colanic/teichoic acid biosynthesis glycosyltransferase